MTTAKQPPLAGTGATLIARQKRAQAPRSRTSARRPATDDAAPVAPAAARPFVEPPDPDRYRLTGAAEGFEQAAAAIAAHCNAIQSQARELLYHDVDWPLGAELLETLSLSIGALAEAAEREARAIEALARRTA